MNDLANAPWSDNRNGRQLVTVAESVPALRDPYGRLALYGGGIAEEQELSLNLSEYWRILYKRKWLILGIAAAFGALSSIATLTQPPSFTSTVRLQIDPPPKVVDAGNTEDFSDYQFMQTQYQLLESRTMAERVAGSLNLSKDAVGGVTVSPLKDSRLVDLMYTDADPARAQQ